MTEYSGFRFLIFFIAEFATAGVFAAIAATLFLGGWCAPFGLDARRANWMNVVGPLILFTKMHADRRPHHVGPLHLPALP